VEPIEQGMNGLDVMKRHADDDDIIPSAQEARIPRIEKQRPDVSQILPVALRPQHVEHALGTIGPRDRSHAGGDSKRHQSRSTTEIQDAHGRIERYLFLHRGE
jgi:hypothetical protein